MRQLSALVLAGFVVVGCQQDGQDSQGFLPTMLSVQLEETDSSLELHGYSSASNGIVTKAALWCNDQQRQVFEFDSTSQATELFGVVENCKLELLEFKIDERVFKVGNQYAAGIYEFQARNDQNRLIDNRLVRSKQEIGKGEQLDPCKKDCKFTEVSVVFPYSVLDIRNEILENTVVYTELNVGMEEEDAPVCDSFSAKFQNGADFLTPPTLVISLKNCQNTIGTDNLEFGLDKEQLTASGSFARQFLITDAQRLIVNLPVEPVRDGNDYTITMSLDEIKDLWVDEVPSTVEALTTDFALAIRNQGGISALVYAIQNQCVVKHDDKGKKKRRN